jgi:ankyrin repeat protein
LLQKGSKLWDVGHVCLSRKRRNSGASNVVGAAAYYGHPTLLKFILSRLSNSLEDQVNLKSMESQDIRPLKTGAYQTEFDGFTPLMLAVVSEKSNLDVVKQLLANQANFNIREKVTGDNILHLAARYCPKLEVIEYLVRSLNQEMLFERNLKGDTPLSICIT